MPSYAVSSSSDNLNSSSSTPQQNSTLKKKLKMPAPATATPTNASATPSSSTKAKKSNNTPKPKKSLKKSTVKPLDKMDVDVDMDGSVSVSVAAPATPSTIVNGDLNGKKKNSAAVIVNGDNNNNNENNNNKEKQPKSSKRDKSTTSTTKRKDAFVVRHASGGLVATSRVVFTHDGSAYMSSVDSTIVVYNATNGKPIRVISSSANNGHTEKITSICLNPANALQLFSASLDGSIRLWDYQDGVLLKKWDIQQPITQLLFHPTNPQTAYISTIPTDSNIKLTTISSLTISPANLTPSLTKITKSKEIVSIHIQPPTTTATNTTPFLVILTQTQFKLHDLTTQKTTIHAHDLTITTLTIHPTNPIIAVGDIRGKITLYYLSPHQSFSVQTTQTLHWHAHRVGCLQFTQDGNYLLSGGQEAVLVLWQLENRHKTFLPRLGGALTGLSLSRDEKYLAITVGGVNSIKIIQTSNMSDVAESDGLKLACMDLKKYPCEVFMVEPRRGHVVLNAETGKLQVWDYKRGVSVSEMDITPHNRVSRTEDKELTHPHVHHINYSTDGEWMATVDVRDDTDFPTEVFLKFWKWSSEHQTYTLHTRIDHPHDSHPITSLTFRTPQDPTQQPIAITTGKDKTFRIWQLTETSSTNTTTSESFWTCRSAATYRDLQPLSSAISEDGSLLIISFTEGVITIWNPLTNQFINSIVTPKWGSATSVRVLDHYLIALFEQVSRNGNVKSRGEKRIAVWDLLKFKLEWSACVVLPISENDKEPTERSLGKVLLQTPTWKPKSSTSTQKFIVSTPTRIFLFSPSSPVPLQSHALPTPFIRITFAPGNEGIIGVDTNTIIKSLFPTDFISAKDVAKQLATKTVDMDAQVDSKPVMNTYFSTVYGNKEVLTPAGSVVNSPKKEKKKQVANTSSVLGLSFLDSAAHVLPAPGMWVTKYLETVVLKKRVLEVVEEVTNIPMEVVEEKEEKVVKVRSGNEFGFLEECFKGLEVGSKVSDEFATPKKLDDAPRSRATRGAAKKKAGNKNENGAMDVDENVNDGNGGVAATPGGKRKRVVGK